MASDFKLRDYPAEAFFAPAEIHGRQVDPFFNVNRADDLAAAEALLARARSEPS